MASAARFVCAVGAVLAILCLSACFTGGDSSGATVLCRGTTAEVKYDPEHGVEVTSSGEDVGWADAGDRHLNTDDCEQVATQEGWFVGIRYTKAGQPETLQCRFPGRFFLHVHPTYSSESGEMFPDGNALYVVIPERQTIAVSSAIGEDEDKSRLMFSKRYCARG